MLRCIAQENNIDLIRKFVAEADGDYIIYIIKGKQIVIFNDYMGRLPLYYHLDNYQNFFASRKLNFILSNIQECIISKKSIAEYFMFEFQHGTKTLFRDIKKLDAHQILVFQNGLLEIQDSISQSFDTKVETKDLVSSLVS